MIQPQVKHAPLSALAIDETNVRVTGRGSEPMFAGSIGAKGVIEPLVVRPNGSGETYKVTNGSKRLDALHWLRDHKRKANGIAVTDAYPVPILIIEADDKQARDISLTLNVVRAAMHPVDEFEAFVTLQRDGMTIDAIASEYGKTRKEVEQALALGALAPVVREAWREKKITADAAQAFTIAADHAHQESLFKRLSKDRNLSAWNVKRDLRGDQQEAGGLLKLVGRDAYAKAGGGFRADLFTTDKDDAEIIADAGLLRKLADEKIAAEIDRLTTKEGWGWAELDTGGKRFSYDQQNGKLSAEEKKKRGCFLNIDFNGKLTTGTGYMKSKAKQAGERASETKAAKPKNSNAISNALSRRLRGQLETAIKGALIAHPHKDALGTLLAGITAKLIDATNDHYSGHTPHEISDAMMKIADAIHPTAMGVQLLNKFDAKGYFEGINAQFLKTALVAMQPPTAVGPPKANKKSELVKLAVAEQKRTGWLPKELRTSHYDGPGGKAVAPKPKPKTKAKR